MAKICHAGERAAILKSADQSKWLCRGSRESAGKPDALQTLRDKARRGEQIRASVWSASGLPALSHATLALIAIDLAHFSLGHYQKYASQLSGAQSQPISINSVVTPAEWRQAVLKGAQSALDCGLAVDGLKVLFESIDNMPSRPPWTIFLMPSGVKVGKLNRELDSIQRKAFLSFNR